MAFAISIKNNIIKNWNESTSDVKAYTVIAFISSIFMIVSVIANVVGNEELRINSCLLSFLWPPVVMGTMLLYTMFIVEKLIIIIHTQISLIPYFWHTVATILGVYVFIRVFRKAIKLNARELISWIVFIVQFAAFICALPLILETKYNKDTCQNVMLSCVFIIFSAMMIRREYVPQNLHLTWDTGSVIVAGAIWLVTRYLKVSNDLCVLIAVIFSPLFIYLTYYFMLGRHYNERANLEAIYPELRYNRLRKEAEDNAKWWDNLENSVRAYSKTLLLFAFVCNIFIVHPLLGLAVLFTLIIYFSH